MGCKQRIQRGGDCSGFGREGQLANPVSYRRRIKRSVIASSAVDRPAASEQTLLKLAAAGCATKTRLERCVLAEAEEQRRSLSKAYNEASDQALLREGIVLINLALFLHGRLYGDVVWRVGLSNGSQLPVHKFKKGASVALRLMKSKREESIEAVVLETTASYLLISTSTKESIALLTEWANGQNCRLEMGAQEATTQRQLAALEQLPSVHNSMRRGELAVRAILVGSPRAPQLAAMSPEWMRQKSWQLASGSALNSLSGVNESQRAAIAAALHRTLTLWQGPPGTGKTRTLLKFLSVICQLTSMPERRQQIGTVLAVCDTNAAADNLLEGLLRLDIHSVCRVGQPAKVRAELRNYCLDALAEGTSRGRQAAELRDRAAMEFKNVATMKAADELSAKEIAELQREAEHMWSQAEIQLVQASQDVLHSSHVVVATCAAAGEARLAQWSWRLVVVDEATQSTEPSTLIALVKGAECVVMAGDHAQLPPTVISKEALENRLDVPLFARLQNYGVPALLLSMQYRMHPAIAAFPSAQFYGGRIQSGVTEQERHIPRRFLWPNPHFPVAFVPCAGLEERGTAGPINVSAQRSASFRNKSQANAAIRCLRSFLYDAKSSAAAPLSTTVVALLTPYEAQARLLRGLVQKFFLPELDSGRVVVSSVDGYQGREADVVVFSTVRSNPARNLGFVADKRRMNVGITRARNGLVVLGCPDTLRSSPDWEAWLEWMIAHKAVSPLFSNTS